MCVCVVIGTRLVVIRRAQSFFGVCYRWKDKLKIEVSDVAMLHTRRKRELVTVKMCGKIEQDA